MGNMRFKWDQRFMLMDSDITEAADSGAVIRTQSGKCNFSISRIVLSILSPFLKDILLEMCPCVSPTIILPDFTDESLQCLQELLSKSYRNSNDVLNVDMDFLTAMGISVPSMSTAVIVSSRRSCSPSNAAIGSGDKANDRDQELLESQMRNLYLEKVSYQCPQHSNLSDIDMFLTDDEIIVNSPTLTRKRAEQTITMSKVSVFSDVETVAGHSSMNETVFEDAAEEVEESIDKDVTPSVDEDEEQLKFPEDARRDVTEVANVADSCIDDVENNQGSREEVPTETETEDQDVDVGVQVDDSSEVNETSSFDNPSVSGEEEECSEEETECSEDEESEGENSTDESCSDPSWEADVDNSSASDEECDDKKVKRLERSAVKNMSRVQSSNLSMMERSSLSFYMSDSGPIDLAIRCGCKGSCLRNCACKTAKMECSQWCSCDSFKCKSKIDQRQAKKHITEEEEKVDTEQEAVAEVLLDVGDGEVALARTPESLPPPLSCSTVELSMTSRRKKKLFTEKLGPQEFE